MGFYHSTTVLYGAQVKTDDPHRTEYHVLDLPAAEEVFNSWGVNHALIGAADSEQVFLYTDHNDLEPGDFFVVVEADCGKLQLWRDRITGCAKELGVQLDHLPGWVVAHEYR